MQVPADSAGPTAERLAKAGANDPDKNQHFYTVAGRARSARKITMIDDALGKSWVRRIISGQEYQALQRFALHWVAGGLQGHLNSVDLNRIYAFNPSAMSGLAHSEAQVDHRRTYYGAKEAIGFRPAYVADQVACYGRGLQETGESMGFKSPYRARERAGQYLSSAGHGLIDYFESLRPR